MGYIRHHAIVVTSWNDIKLKVAHVYAKGVFGETVSEIIDSPVNSYQSFFIAPDGSKEGWQPSNEGDKKRELFADWIKNQDYEDGSNSLSFAVFFYGDDDGDAGIEIHN